jgi:hypothetical protein
MKKRLAGSVETNLSGKVISLEANKEPEPLLVAFFYQRSQRRPRGRDQGANFHGKAVYLEAGAVGVKGESRGRRIRLVSG